MGPVAYGDNQDTVFLGRDITRNDHLSEDTARKIDSEIHRIIDEQYQRATTIISEKRNALDKIADALLQYETIEGKHVLEILETGSISSPVIVAPPPLKPGSNDQGKKAKKKSADDEAIAPDGTPEPSPA